MTSSQTVATTMSYLCYHDPDVLATTRDMVTDSEQTARAEGAVPCSQCFSGQESTQYPFQYVTDEHIALVGGQR